MLIVLHIIIGLNLYLPPMDQMTMTTKATKWTISYVFDIYLFLISDIFFYFYFYVMKENRGYEFKVQFVVASRLILPKFLTLSNFTK